MLKCKLVVSEKGHDYRQRPIDMNAREVFMLLYVKWKRHRYFEDSREYCPQCKAIGLEVYAPKGRPISFACGLCHWGIRRRKVRGSRYYVYQIHDCMEFKNGRCEQRVKAMGLDHYTERIAGGHYNALLTPSAVREIRVLRQDGATYRELANIYDVAFPTIRDVCERRTWKHVR